MPSNTQDMAMQQRALPSAIDDLQRAISSLETTMYNLRSQLAPVLDSPNCLPGEDGEIKSSVAPLHYSTQINDVVSRIRDLNSTGTDLLSRLHT